MLLLVILVGYKYCLFLYESRVYAAFFFFFLQIVFIRNKEPYTRLHTYTHLKILIFERFVQHYTETHGNVRQRKTDRNIHLLKKKTA